VAAFLGEKMAKADVVAEAVEMGLGDTETLSKYTVVDLRQKMEDKRNNIEEIIVAKSPQPPAKQCVHEYHHVRVVANPSNYVCDRCWKCGDEINIEQ
jgi:hypothetical protein